VLCVCHHTPKASSEIKNKQNVMIYTSPLSVIIIIIIIIIFAESQGTLLGNGTTRVCATAVTSLNSETAAGSDVFHAVRRHADNDATVEHINRISAKRSDFCGVRPEAISGEPMGALS
jgi:hypothetical protein